MNALQNRAITVSELNEYARRLLAGDPLLRDIEVSGEISGYKHHFSGHRYFSLKDASARVQCVMFRQDAMRLDFEPKDGMKVTVRASASIFVRDGGYQLYVSAMAQAGLGDLYAKFEQLKAKLAAEGLFDPARKRAIPLMPKKIGIATSETGAAVRDMIRVARRRNPNVGILIAPCAVQGASAAPEIIRAIRRLNENSECDVLLVGRGGGSIEDLWAFNEEGVARAIAASRIPVISCVGHEIDFTIADFVADLRAPTPSAAAELAVPVLSELTASLDALSNRLSTALTRGQTARRLSLERLCASAVLTAPRRLLTERRAERLCALQSRLSAAMNAQTARAQHRLTSAAGVLRSLNPENVVERGYAIVRHGRGIVTDAANVAPGDALEICISGGKIGATADYVLVGERTDGEEKTDV